MGKSESTEGDVPEVFSLSNRLTRPPKQVRKETSTRRSLILASVSVIAVAWLSGATVRLIPTSVSVGIRHTAAPHLEVRNFGAAVRVAPWRGARTAIVGCGMVRGVDTSRASAPPWRVTVRSARTGHVLHQASVHSGFGYALLTVDQGRAYVMHGDFPPQGPPVVCRSTSP